MQVKAQSTCDLLRARWCEPVLSVVDVRVGDDEEAATDPFYRFGPTRFSVIPRSAVGNVSVRFVPDQVRPLIYPSLEDTQHSIICNVEGGGVHNTHPCVQVAADIAHTCQYGQVSESTGSSMCASNTVLYAMACIESNGLHREQAGAFRAL